MMATEHTQELLEEVFVAPMPQRRDIEAVLRLEDERHVARLFNFAERVRRNYVGDGVLLRGIIEFSNVCRNTCAYCGLHRGNKQLRRYRLSDSEILAAAERIHEAGIKTVVLQSGEEDDLDADWLKQIIETIKLRFGTAVTLSVGERSRDEYALWKQAGADRYLLKIETSDWQLYEELHPGMSFENRTRCLQDLAELGYQTGSGDLVGLPGQSIECLAEDILFFKRGNFGMLSVSPFIPHAQTPLADAPTGDLQMTLKMIALARIVRRDAHIPASTAIGSLHGRDERPRALAAGANVVMPNFTPQRVKSLYEIYPDKAGRDASPQENVLAVQRMVTMMGRHVDLARGDSLKPRFSVTSAGANGN